MKSSHLFLRLTAKRPHLSRLTQRVKQPPPFFFFRLILSFLAIPLFKTKYKKNQISDIKIPKGGEIMDQNQKQSKTPPISLHTSHASLLDRTLQCEVRILCDLHFRLVTYQQAQIQAQFACGPLATADDVPWECIALTQYDASKVYLLFTPEENERMRKFYVEYFLHIAEDWICEIRRKTALIKNSAQPNTHWTRDSRMWIEEG